MGHALRGLAVCALSVVTASPSFADDAKPGKTRLSYSKGDGAERCPDAAQLEDAVAARLGYRPFADDAESTVDVRVSSDAAGLRAAIELRDRRDGVRGSRELTSEAGDCAELAEAMALGISIAVDPAAASGRTRAPSPADEKARTSPPPPPAAAAPARDQVQKPARVAPGPRVRGSVGALGSLGSAPSAAFGLTGQLGLRWPSFSLALEGRGDLPASEDLGGGREASTSLLLATLVPCAHASVWLGCALLSAGALAGEGRGLRHARTDRSPYAGAGARIGVELPLATLLALRLHADVLASFTRTTLHVDDESVWTTPAASGAVGAAMVGTIP